MASIGPKTATSGSGGSWTPDSGTLATACATKDSVYAKASAGATGYLALGSFGFGLAGTETILGITVRVSANLNSPGSAVADADLDVGLSKDGSTVSGTAKSYSVIGTATDSDATQGTTADLWGATWTSTEVNGLYVLIKRGAASAESPTKERWVNLVEVTVYYVPAGMPVALASIMSKTVRQIPPYSLIRNPRGKLK